MLRYAEPQPVTQLAGERDALVSLPLGAGAVIPPWNFPLAILTGMSSAAIVTGNTVVVKPSSDSPAIAWQLFALLEEVGLPPGVFQYVTGGGGTVGDTLVRHPRTRFVAFTGSRDVGVSIHRLATSLGPVINAAARDKILSYIERGKREGGRLLTGGGAVPGREGWFVEPTVFHDVRPEARIAQEEIFGPVLAVIPVSSFDEAL